MTKSAKQGTAKPPAESAETESAATQAATDGQQAAEPAAAAAQAANEDQAGHDAQGEAPDLDETKRKFREALERKHQVHTEGQGKGGKDGGKISGAHGPAASRRSFRRKSG
jgi:hypothetical protein